MVTLEWIDDHRLAGTLAIKLAPGLGRDTRNRAIDEALVAALDAAAAEQTLIRTAQPSRFVHEQPGRDEEGRTTFAVRGRAEGDFLVPA
jgi:hypothetical protein